MAGQSTFLAYVAAIVLSATIAVYFFGIPRQLKRSLERTALNTMGENKMSYLIKDQISKIPTTDQRQAKDIKNRVGNTASVLVKNPLGETVGEVGDTLTSPFTGR